MKLPLALLAPRDRGKSLPLLLSDGNGYVFKAVP